MLDESASGISRSIAPTNYNISAYSRFSLAKLEAAAAMTSDLRDVAVDGGRREGHHEEVLCWKAQEEKGEVDIRRRAALCYAKENQNKGE
ncbi:hypothetical protein BHM03_00049350 [Ensete ventricosum]|nr:hypothetical protein BHM03_00049350 [Ensete ventricosum]